MANPLKGETPFEDQGRELVLVFDIDALCNLEEAVNLGVLEIVGQLGAGMRLGLMRQIMLVGLRGRQPDITLREAGEIIGRVGIGEAGELIGAAFLAAFPKTEEAAPGDARPPSRATRRRAARAGTGPAS